MSDWQHIDTAPKDGTRLLLFCRDYDPPFFVGNYNWTELPTDHEDYWAGWSFSEELISNHCEIEPEPTHWMPLPAAPDEAADAA